MFKILKITGNSLYPEYKDGDFVILMTIPVFFHPFSVGKLIVFDHPIYGKMIKRISKTDYISRKVFVSGDHEESLDSRQLGWINFSAVNGSVIHHIPRKN
jgi:signal peptidase I